MPDDLRLGYIRLIERPRPGNVLAMDADQGVIIIAFALDRWYGLFNGSSCAIQTSKTT